MSEGTLSCGHTRKILVCTDFSENARFAFDFAVDAAARHTGSILYLLHVIPEPDAQFWRGYVEEVEDIEAKALEDVERKIASEYRPYVPEGIPFVVEKRIGDASRMILAYAEQEGVDLIVLGRQGSGAITQWLLGNVAGKVARKAHCPVLVVPLAFKARSTAVPSTE